MMIQYSNVATIHSYPLHWLSSGEVRNFVPPGAADRDGGSQWHSYREYTQNECIKVRDTGLFRRYYLDCDRLWHHVLGNWVHTCGWRSFARYPGQYKKADEGISLMLTLESCNSLAAKSWDKRKDTNVSTRRNPVGIQTISKYFPLAR